MPDTITLNPPCPSCPPDCFEIVATGCSCNAASSCGCTCESAGYGQTSSTCPDGQVAVPKPEHTCSCSANPGVCYDCVTPPACEYCGPLFGGGPCVNGGADSSMSGCGGYASLWSPSSCGNLTETTTFTGTGTAYIAVYPDGIGGSSTDDLIATNLYAGSSPVTVAGILTTNITYVKQSSGLPDCQNSSFSWSGYWTFVSNAGASIRTSDGLYHTVGSGDLSATWTLTGAPGDWFANSILSSHVPSWLHRSGSPAFPHVCPLLTPSIVASNPEPCTCPSGWLASGSECVYTG